MAITIPSLKSGDTLFITLGDIAHGKKLHYLFIACWKSIIASFIDNFTQKNGTKRQQRDRRDRRCCRGGDSTLFSLHFSAITTRLKKKAAPYFELMNKEKKLFEKFSVEVI